MLASSSSSRLLPSNNGIGWSFESSKENCIYKVAAEKTCDDQSSLLFHLQYFPPPMEVDDKSTPSTIIVDDARVLMASRRLNHNASERDRRKKINAFFSSLRSVIPRHDQKKRLSNPAAVSQALKYIPNLQKQVEELVEKKKQLMLSMMTRRQEEVSWKNKVVGRISCPLLAVSTNRLNDREFVVQISTFHGIPLSCILLGLLEDGLHPLNISSSLSFGGKIFYNLHLQVEKQRIRLYENIDYISKHFG